MNRRDVHRFDRLHQVREVEQQRCRQDLVAANAALREATRLRDLAMAAAGAPPVNGVRDLAVFQNEVAMGRLRTEQLESAHQQVVQAEAAVTASYHLWTLAARRVQGLDKLVARRRETQRAEELLAEAHEHQDLFLARRAMGLV
jgi:hypothetical protein